MKYIKSLALSLTVPFLLTTPNAALAQNANIDQQYVTFLYDSLWELNPLAHSMAKDHLTQQENVAYAHLMCEGFGEGYTLEQMAEGIAASIDAESLPPSSQEAIGSYIGAVAYAGTIYYCPEHRLQLENVSQSY
jgi:hypothetical protein